MIRIKNLSLRAKMVCGGILFALIPLIIIGTVTFVNSSHVLEKISKGLLSQTAQGLAGTIHGAISRELKILRAVAEDSLVVKAASTGEYDIIDAKFIDLFNKIGLDYEDIVIFDQDGIIRSAGADKNRLGINIADRDYFHATKKGNIGIGTPVLSKATNQPIFGLSAPILSQEGNFIGGVLGVVKTEFLVKHIASVKVGRTGYSFMIDRQGFTISHPDKSFILTMNMTREHGLNDIAMKMILQQTGAEEYTFRGTRKVAGFSPVELTGWSIAVTQNKAEIMVLAYENRDLILLASFAFLAITTLAVFFFSRTISRPVQKTLTTLNQAIEQATEAIFIVGLDRKVQFVNPAMAAIIDRPVQDLIGKAPYLENLSQTSSEEIWAVLEKGKIWNGCVTGNIKEGLSFFMDISITPVRNETGDVNCFLGIGRDITRELMMEAHMRQSQKMEAIGTLAGGIAHDFNNILSAVFGYTELTIRSIENREKSLHFLTEIFKAAGRARDLVNQILTFSRQTDLGEKPFMPKFVIKEALKLLRASLPATIEIQENMRSDASILGDPTQIHQVIMNLGTNAGYAMKDQGGILHVTLEDIDLDEAFSIHHPGISPGRHLVLKVSDSGSGIPREIEERIFDPFFTTKPQGEGTGLGLSVVHGVVKALRGTIKVASETGKGTAIIIYLPVIHAEPPQVDGEAQDEVQGGSERILIVDDEDALIRTGKAILENLGYKVQGFTESHAAWETFLKNPNDFDAVITDYTMPHMTGYELAIKMREIREDIPIILCSGYIDETMEKIVQNAGINEFLKKPITRQDIAHVLRRVLGTIINR
ncbi:MAG: cache domain-containing protein [Pseudomonadota bacterium]